MKIKNKGFTLIELLIALTVICILAAISWPLYKNYVTKSKRIAASTCLMEAGQYMERFYTQNMRYDETKDGEEVDIPTLECANNLSDDYVFSIDSVDENSYKLIADPTGRQATEDEECATLSINQKGKKDITGTADVAHCWK